MIARIWHGFTKPEHADAYEERRKYLSHYDAKSSHYEVASIHGL
jgi:hypothetical protein